MNIVTLKKDSTSHLSMGEPRSQALLDRDGLVGSFRAMTLEEAKALPRGSYIWLRMTNGGAQQFKTYNTGITNLKRVRLATLCFDITEREILDGQVLVEITRDEEPL